MHINPFNRKNEHLNPPPMPGRSKTLVVSKGVLAGIIMMTLVLGASLHRGYDLLRGKHYFRGESSFLRNDIEQNAQNIEYVRKQAEDQLYALTSRVAELQARIMRLDALGERLVTMEALDSEEFDFSGAPAMGGPEVSELMDLEARPDFLTALDQLASDLERREEQLAVLDKLLSSKRYSEQTMLSGKPVRKGWITSRFGRRIDPFSGRGSRHEGVDFAGKVGADILSVGDGVVTWAGERFGYGLMVEINHGKSYTTRYGHAQHIDVKVGDVVKKGQVIAKMGNTGRSTGTHVHFEVRRDGVALDPARVLFRRS